jgi:hypothetical protein
MWRALLGYGEMTDNRGETNVVSPIEYLVYYPRVGEPGDFLLSKMTPLKD